MAISLEKLPTIFRGTGTFDGTIYAKKDNKLYGIDVTSLLSNDERRALGNSQAQSLEGLNRLGVNLNDIKQVLIPDLDPGIPRGVGNLTANDLQQLLQQYPIAGTQGGKTVIASGQGAVDNIVGAGGAQSGTVVNDVPQTYAPPFGTPAPVIGNRVSVSNQTQLPTKAQLQPGSQGTDVKALQDFLVSTGYLTAEDLATGPGIYGPRTTDAVKRLQEALGVDTSGGGIGYYGPRTQAAIEQYINAGQLRSGGNVSSTGIPSNLPNTPTVNFNAPIPASGLSGLPSASDLESILSATSGKSAANDASIKGLLELLNSPGVGESELTTLFDEYFSKQKSAASGASNDLASKLESDVFPKLKQVQELNLKATQLQGELSSFDAKTNEYNQNLEGQTIPTGLIVGQQAELNKTRALQRSSKAAELATTVALAQAYQDNATISLDLAKTAVDIKYAPIEAEIDVLKQQIERASEVFAGKDAKNMKVIETLLNIRLDEIDQEKADAKQLNELGAKAALAGAPLSVVQQAIGTGSLTQASSILGPYVAEKEKTGSSDSASSYNFTSTQETKLFGLGLTASEIDALKSDIKTGGIDAALEGFDAKLQSGVREILTGEATQFISSEYLKKIYTTEELTTAAEDSGYLKGTWPFRTGDVDAYIAALLKQVETYRDAGYTDKEAMKFLEG